MKKVWIRDRDDKSKMPILFLNLLFFAIPILYSCQTQTEKTPLVNGYTLPNITLPNTSNEITPLTELKGKIVLVEFWASWCQPCRVKHPELNRIYEEYNDAEFETANGFEIYYVDLDKKESDWVNAMKKDGIDHWNYHVADLVGMKKSDIPKQFQFEQIPTAFLIDENGTIIGKDLTEDRLFHELKFRLKK